MDEIQDVANAVEEVAKTAGKIIDVSREFGKFIAPFMIPPLKQGSQLVTDWLHGCHWEWQQRFMQRVAEFQRRKGLTEPTQYVPLKIVIPLLQSAFLEDDDYLQDRWAALLVNAADADFGAEIHRSYLSILEQVTPLEAQILETIYSVPFDETKDKDIITADLPNSAQVAQSDKTYPDPSDEVKLALGNLVRLNCVRLQTIWSGSEHFKAIRPTVLGRAFVNACHLP